VSLPVLFRPDAETEIIEAWDWYEMRHQGLGAEAAISRAARVPDANPRVHGEVRRELLRRFPFGVFYVVENETLLVLAVAHARRKPGYWADRM